MFGSQEPPSSQIATVTPSPLLPLRRGETFFLILFLFVFFGVEYKFVEIEVGTILVMTFKTNSGSELLRRLFSFSSFTTFAVTHVVLLYHSQPPGGGG